MSNTTGKAMGELDHLRQCVDVILSTPLGTRCMNPDFGSGLFSQIDQPVTDGWLLDGIDNTAAALERWEDRLEIERVEIGLNEQTQQNSMQITLDGNYLPGGQPIRLEGLEIA